MRKGVLRGEFVYISGNLVEKLYKQGYGEMIGEDTLEIHALEAAHLVWTNKITVVDESNEQVGLSVLFNLIAKDPRGFLKFVVYSDLRRRNRVVVHERATDFLRLYPKGKKVGDAAAKELVFSLSEDEPITHKFVLDMVEKVARLRKSLILAVVDDEMNVTYYKAQNFMPDKREGYPLDELPLVTGTIIGDRVIVFDENAGDLYVNGFWGHPLGIEKPDPLKRYDVPLQLPLIEAIYLASKGKLKVRTYDGKDKNLSELREEFSKGRERAKLREIVYTYWRDLGFIPKAGSKYGVDFLVYERGPGLEHAPYVCLIGGVNDKIRPVDLIRSGRIATSVRKDLVVSLVSGKNVVSYKLTWFKP